MAHVAGRDTEFTVAVALVLTLPLPLPPSLSSGYGDQQPSRRLVYYLLLPLLLHLCVFRRNEPFELLLLQL